jgi:hypothetical protein
VTDSQPTDITWHKSTASGGGGSNCVEVAAVDGSVLVRNSRNPLGSVLSFPCRPWATFLAGVRNGELTLEPVVPYAGVQCEQPLE